MPVAKWLRNELRQDLLQTLNSEIIIAQGIFNHEYLEKLLSQHLDGKCDHRKQLWTLYIFQKWYKQFG